MIKTRNTLAAALLVLLPAIPAAATEPGLFVDLNKIENVPSGCRLTYVVRNDTGSSLTGNSVVISVFNASGTFSRKVVFRFGGIDANRSNVRQFDLVGSPCEDISKLLIDDITECATDDGAEMDCVSALVTSSSTDIELAY